MATLDMVSAAIQAAVHDALTNAGYTVPVLQIAVGAPFGPSLSEILGQNQSQITIYPLDAASKNLTSRRPIWRDLSVQTPPVTASIGTFFNQYKLTFTAPGGSGVIWDAVPVPFQWDNSPTPATWDNFSPAPLPAGINVHTFFGAPLNDLAYQTQAGETVNTLAAAVASGINALNYDLASATASGNTVTVSDSPYLFCNIGWTGVMVREVRRMQTPFQVTVWAANPDDRTAIANIIDSYVAIDTTPFLEAADHAAIRIRLTRPSWDDDSQASYSLYCAHFVYECEYPTLQTIVSTTIESVGNTLDIQTPSGVQQDPVRYIHD